MFKITEGHAKTTVHQQQPQHQAGDQWLPTSVFLIGQSNFTKHWENVKISESLKNNSKYEMFVAKDIHLKHLIVILKLSDIS